MNGNDESIGESVTYGGITRSRGAIGQLLPDKLVEPFFLLAVTVVVSVGAHEAGYDERHVACVAWRGFVYVVWLRRRIG